MTDKNIVIVDEDIKEIIPNFIENRLQDIKDLKTLIENKDFDQIQIIGHKMSGNAPSYGFNLLGEVGHNIENYSKEKNLKDIQIEYQKFIDFMDNYEIKYES